MTDNSQGPENPIPEDEFVEEDFDTILEWTPEEEEEFLRIFGQEDIV